MEYFGFTETADFTRKVNHLLDDDELLKLQLFLCDYPDHGDLIPGSGGIRKMRCRIRGSGKRGGARMIYFAAISKGRILLLDIYPKSEKVDLSKAELKKLRGTVDRWLSRK